MIYFTSDLHLGHNAVINMQNRPFADADEMEWMQMDITLCRLIRLRTSLRAL